MATKTTKFNTATELLVKEAEKGVVEIAQYLSGLDVEVPSNPPKSKLKLTKVDSDWPFTTAKTCRAPLDYTGDSGGCGNEDCCPPQKTQYAKAQTQCDLKPGHAGRHEGPIHYTKTDIRVSWGGADAKPKS